MANAANLFPHILNREIGNLKNLKSHLFEKRLYAAKNLYRRDLVCHFGCVNAIEFSNNGEILISGGDDRRVMVWKFNHTILDYGKPEPMRGQHQSNIFCFGITSDSKKVFSGGNDDMVIVHDMETKRPLEVLQHHRAVCGLSIDPFNEQVVSTAGNDGRLLLFDTRQSVHESLVISRSRKAFHGVMFHPQQVGLLVSANARDGVGLWDLRSPKHPVVRYVGNNGASQNCMSVRFNASGSSVLALRRRQSPVLYGTHSPDPIAEFYHQDYYNSCTMKSCCFAGENDQYVLSGSDDFNLYMWKIPDGDEAGADDEESAVVTPHIVLFGHRSIVNQVRYNPHYCLIASSGVEKIIKIWSAFEYPGMRGSLSREPADLREMYSHEDYVSLAHQGNYISHNYVDQSTSEDPRMMAFFDSLVQRELECLVHETDSLDGSSSLASIVQSHASDSSDSDQIVVDFLPLPPKRVMANGSRSQRCPNRLARLVASRYPKNLRAQKRGLLRRSKNPRPCLLKRSSKGPRACRCPRRPRPPPDSDRTDSDEPARLSRRTTHRIIRPLRRRMHLSRAVKRKCKSACYRKTNSRLSGPSMVRDMTDSNLPNVDNGDDNLALPSTSTGYRGPSSSVLFRIAEVDSDDDQSASSRPFSPPSNDVPLNLINIVPTPVNGSRDSLADSLRIDTHDEPTIDHRLRNIRRPRRNGRPSLHRSDSSESPPPKEVERPISPSVQQKPSYNRTVARLMNETNESELESSCSTEGARPNDSLDQKCRRVKKARRNYRNNMESDST